MRFNFDNIHTYIYIHTYIHTYISLLEEVQKSVASKTSLAALKDGIPYIHTYITSYEFTNIFELFHMIVFTYLDLIVEYRKLENQVRKLSQFVKPNIYIHIYTYIYIHTYIHIYIYMHKVL